MVGTLLEDVNELLSLSVGDTGRLTHIKDSLENDKALYASDRKYVENLALKHIHIKKQSSKQSSEIHKNIPVSNIKRKESSSITRVGIGLGGLVLIFIVVLFVLPDSERTSPPTNTGYGDEIQGDEYEIQGDEYYFLEPQLEDDLAYEEVDLFDQEKIDLKKQVEIANARTNPVISGLINGVITYYVEPLPSWSTYNLDLFNDFLDGGNAEGVKLKRVFDRSEADFGISWIKDYGDESLGVAYSKTSATVGLGSSMCGDWQHFDNFSITKVTWHEIGHVLGYDHSDDPKNIMFPNGDTKYKHDKDIKQTIPPNWYWPYTFCNDGEQEYHFKTDKTKYDAFEIVVVPPETDVKKFVMGGSGETYYPSCEELDKRWYAKGNTCNVKKGSKVIIHNNNDKAIKIEGYMENKKPHPEIEMRWDNNFYQYDPEYINYVRELFSK